jgi:hypothetical protein
VLVEIAHERNDTYQIADALALEQKLVQLVDVVAHYWPDIVAHDQVVVYETHDPVDFVRLDYAFHLQTPIAQHVVQIDVFVFVANSERGLVQRKPYRVFEKLIVGIFEEWVLMPKVAVSGERLYASIARVQNIEIFVGKQDVFWAGELTARLAFSSNDFFEFCQLHVQNINVRRELVAHVQVWHVVGAHADRIVESHVFDLIDLLFDYVGIAVDQDEPVEVRIGEKNVGAAELAYSVHAREPCVQFDYFVCVAYLIESVNIYVEWWVQQADIWLNNLLIAQLEYFFMAYELFILFEIVSIRLQKWLESFQPLGWVQVDRIQFILDRFNV